MKMFSLAGLLRSIGLAVTVSGCSSSPTPEPDARSVVTSMHDSLLSDIRSLREAAESLQAAAPTSPDRGWDASQDQASLEAMRGAWKRARTAYEYSEGALAPIFPDIDVDIDARYDDFLLELKAPDEDLFDDRGVIGLHAVERILYADAIPARVVAFESKLDAYRPAAFPALAPEAARFHDLLLGRLINDASRLEAQWTPAKIDLPEAFSGLIALMNEQREKVNKASTNQEESRYSQRTLGDIRDNLTGTRKIFEVFRDGLKKKTNAADETRDGPTIDDHIEAGFDRLQALYAETEGEALPAPPPTWSAENPSPTDLDGPFGRLYAGVRAAVDPEAPDSIVVQMKHAAALLGLTRP